MLSRLLSLRWRSEQAPSNKKKKENPKKFHAGFPAHTCDKAQTYRYVYIHSRFPIRRSWLWSYHKGDRSARDKTEDYLQSWDAPSCSGEFEEPGSSWDSPWDRRFFGGVGELFITHTCTCNQRNHKRLMKGRSPQQLQATPKTWIEIDRKVCKKATCQPKPA